MDSRIFKKARRLSTGEGAPEDIGCGYAAL
jgi:hypothetical protein